MNDVDELLHRAGEQFRTQVVAPAPVTLPVPGSRPRRPWAAPLAAALAAVALIAGVAVGVSSLTGSASRPPFPAVGSLAAPAPGLGYEGPAASPRFIARIGPETLLLPLDWAAGPAHAIAVSQQGAIVAHTAYQLEADHIAGSYMTSVFITVSPADPALVAALFAERTSGPGHADSILSHPAWVEAFTDARFGGFTVNYGHVLVDVAANRVSQADAIQLLSGLTGPDLH